MRQLMLDEVEPESQDFIQNGSRHGPETMHRHLIRPDVQGPQRPPQGIGAHRPLPSRIAGIGDYTHKPERLSRTWEPLGGVLRAPKGHLSWVSSTLR